MACPLLWYGRPPDIGNKYPALRRLFHKTGADYLFTICHATWAAEFYPTGFLLRNNEICYQNFSVRHYFSTMTPSPSRRRVVIFFDVDARIRLRRRVDVFSTTSYTTCVDERRSECCAMNKSTVTTFYFLTTLCKTWNKLTFHAILSWSDFSFIFTLPWR